MELLLRAATPPCPQVRYQVLKLERSCDLPRGEEFVLGFKLPFATRGAWRDLVVE